MRGFRKQFEGLEVIAWRPLPTDPTGLGATARSVMPRFSQLFVHAAGTPVMGMALERMAFALRKRFGVAVHALVDVLPPADQQRVRPESQQALLLAADRRYDDATSRPKSQCRQEKPRRRPGRQRPRVLAGES